ncbi:MAG: sigma-54-dependent Fis family transcriptional regulator, partial [bacterium]|nr:sigma-54-dependent Fis family transcriptional regulator [bacterium]
ESKIDEVILAIERAMEKKKLADKVILFENELKSKYKFEEIIGNSTQMLKVLDTVSRVCKTDSTILITGNSGTGKELIGKAIHYNSLRDGQSLVIINSVAIPDNLHESELFGHKKGAFTGALYDKKGLIEEAEGGTLILDEVGDLAMSAQVKLLRFLQSKEIRMVGENIHKKIDVRIIAMTNRDLKADVRNKTFREDLFFRLNVIPIHIPPLQERNRDIMLLIDHILEELKERLHKPNLKISRRAVLLLNGYTWPGNVRELENVLERSSILCGKDEIGPEDLPVEISGLDDQESLSIMNEDISLQEVEKKYIIAAWKKYQGNKSRAAAQLEISRGTLINKLRQYGIE